MNTMMNSKASILEVVDLVWQADFEPQDRSLTYHLTETIEETMPDGSRVRRYVVSDSEGHLRTEDEPPAVAGSFQIRDTAGELVSCAQITPSMSVTLAVLVDILCRKGTIPVVRLPGNVL
jgi:hypothetical protein